MDVSDPYGDDLETYRAIAGEIKYYLNRILDNLILERILIPTL
ncbi:MAG: hypothetical protein ACTSPY_04615 [Candidatus Helarchaeota archaeon]